MVKVPGTGTYSHTSDIIAPADQEIGPSLANTGVVTWPRVPGKAARTTAERERTADLAIWGERGIGADVLDDSVQRGGYAAISTFHFGNPDFTNSEPFLQRWRGQLPYVALRMRMGTSRWWLSDMTTGCRTIFLATEPTWEGWLKALEQNWVVAVRHDAMSKWKTWMHSGSREVLDFVCVREREWKWWDNEAIHRPLVSVVAIKPEDRFEVGQPESGVNAPSALRLGEHSTRITQEGDDGTNKARGGWSRSETDAGFPKSTTWGCNGRSLSPIPHALACSGQACGNCIRTGNRVAKGEQPFSGLPGVRATGK